MVVNSVLKMGAILAAKAISGLVLGLRVRHRERLPTTGPAILVANHNSHLDALVLMALYPLAMAPSLRPVASEQYFLQQNRCLTWFARHVLDIIPIATSNAHEACQDRANRRYFLKHCAEALAQQQILILFPEGTRGQPECLSSFHGGIAHLARYHPAVPIVPIFLTNLGKALPKGDPLLVPFVCGAAIGAPLFWNGRKQAFLQTLTDTVHALSRESQFYFP